MTTERNALNGYYFCKRPKECLYMDMQKYNKKTDCCRKMVELDSLWRQLYCHRDSEEPECKYFKPRKGQLELSQF